MKNVKATQNQRPQTVFLRLVLWGREEGSLPWTIRIAMWKAISKKQNIFLGSPVLILRMPEKRWSD